MRKLDNIELLEKLTGEQDSCLIEALWQDSQEFVLSYTNRSALIPALEKPTRDLVVIAYNRRGTEGELSRSEAGESYHFDTATKYIYDILNKYRLARTGGAVHEIKAEQS